MATSTCARGQVKGGVKEYRPGGGRSSSDSDSGPVKAVAAAALAAASLPVRAASAAVLVFSTLASNAALALSGAVNRLLEETTLDEGLTD